MLSEPVKTSYKCSFFSSLSDLMKSTEVDESLSTTTITVLFQRKPTCFRIYSTEREIYTKITKMLYAPSLIQQGIMLIADILTADLKITTLTQFSTKFNLKWQENTYDKLISAIPIEWRTLIQSNYSIPFIQYQPLLYTEKSIKKKATILFILHSWNNTLFSHKKQSINGRDLHTDDTNTK